MSEAFRKGQVKKEAKIVVKSIESTIENVTANTWGKPRNELYDHIVSNVELKSGHK